MKPCIDTEARVMYGPAGALFAPATPLESELLRLHETANILTVDDRLTGLLPGCDVGSLLCYWRSVG